MYVVRNSAIDMELMKDHSEDAKLQQWILLQLWYPRELLCQCILHLHHSLQELLRVLCWWELCLLWINWIMWYRNCPEDRGRLVSAFCLQLRIRLASNCDNNYFVHFIGIANYSYLSPYYRKDGCCNDLGDSSSSSCQYHKPNCSIDVYCHELERALCDTCHFDRNQYVPTSYLPASIHTDVSQTLKVNRQHR